MSTDKNKNEEEVDLGSLFVIIGNGFNNFFNFIGSVFKGIFHSLIITLLFFKQHLLKILVAGLLGFIFGAYLDYDKGVIYESKMLVKPNFNSTKQLYGNILFYNDLVNQKEYKLLMETFQINQEEAEYLLKGLILRTARHIPLGNKMELIKLFHLDKEQIEEMLKKEYDAH